MEADASELVRDGDRVTGVVARTPRGRLDIHADLVVGCDGRHSVIRDRAQLSRRDLGAPIDVLWMRISRRPDDGEQVLGLFSADKFLVMLNRGDYWQCAYLIEKGGLVALQRRGLDAFRDDLRSLVPMLGSRVDEIRSWDDLKLLTVVVDRLDQWWRPGLLCIGDAAHAMSPVGGVGINLAVQDAIATANLLAVPLRDRRLANSDLASVQARREGPAKKVQRLQRAIHAGVLEKVLAGHGERTLRVVRYLMRHARPIRGYMARTLGVGQLEHVTTPATVDKRSAAQPSRVTPGV
jgi:2-polyprenyl-6-methoxyphenol hydroxylase-like FAD-dependent oxidoreductase